MNDAPLKGSFGGKKLLFQLPRNILSAVRSRLGVKILPLYRKMFFKHITL
jgi:hypothetical protein